MRNSLFVESRLVLFKAPDENKGFLHEQQKQQEQMGSFERDGKFMAEYVQPIIKISTYAGAGKWPEAWAVFYDTFLKDGKARGNTRKYIDLAAKKWNILPKLAGIPVAGTFFKPQNYFLNKGADLANWALDKMTGVDGDKMFDGASREWSKLPPEMQAAFRDTADQMAVDAGIDTVRGGTRAKMEGLWKRFGAERGKV